MPEHPTGQRPSQLTVVYGHLTVHENVGYPLGERPRVGICGLTPHGSGIEDYKIPPEALLHETPVLQPQKVRWHRRDLPYRFLKGEKTFLPDVLSQHLRVRSPAPGVLHGKAVDCLLPGVLGVVYSPLVRDER